MARRRSLTPERGGVRKRLPTKYYAEIGRIITRWAVIEDQLNQLIFRVLWITELEGRLAIRAQRARERVKLLHDILESKGIRLPIDWKFLGTGIDHLQTFRDRLAHNVWVDHPDADVPVMRDFSTSFLKDVPQGHNAKAIPFAVRLPFDYLKMMREGVDAMVRDLARLDYDLYDVLETWQKKRGLKMPDPLPRSQRHKTRTKPRAQPRSSRE